MKPPATTLPLPTVADDRGHGMIDLYRRSKNRDPSSRPYWFRASRTVMVLHPS